MKLSRSFAAAPLLVAACAGSAVRLGGAAPDAGVTSGDAGHAHESGTPRVDATKVSDAHADRAAPILDAAADRTTATDARADRAGGNPDALADQAAIDARTDRTDAPGADAHDATTQDAGGPVEIVSGRSSPSWIVVDSTSVYWSEDGQAGTVGSPNAVMKAAKDGSGLTVLHADVGFPEGLALDGVTLYFVRSLVPGFELDRIATTGDASTFVALFSQNMGGSPGGLSVDGTNAYLGVGSGVLQVPKTSTAPGVAVHIGPDFSDAWEIAENPPLLFVADKTGTTPMTALEVPGGTVDWAVGNGAGIGVACSGPFVYWTAPGGVFLGQAASTPIPIGACATECDAVVADDAGIAWATLSEVIEAAPDGTSPRTLGTGFQGIHHAAIDSTSVYFTDSVGGGVWRVAR
jgi:hypothetical protein